MESAKEIQAPRYKFETLPASVVTLKWRDFAAAIPESARRGPQNPDRIVEFLCQDILQSPTPGIRLVKLAQLAPESIVAEGNGNPLIPLPAAKLALNYRFLQKRLSLPGEATLEIDEVAPKADPATFTPEPKKDSWHSMLSSTAAAAKKLFATPPPAATPEPEIVVPAPEATVLPEEPKKEPEPPGKTAIVPSRERELPDQERLQDLLMTDEELSVQRVMELCSGLPGISSCILSNGPSVVAAHKTPSAVDPVALSNNAIAMLEGMRASSEKMGLGSIPAVTIHSEKGPVSFLTHGKLHLLVLHKDRAFVPGVREKLQDVLFELSRASLPASPAKDALPPNKP